VSAGDSNAHGVKFYGITGYGNIENPSRHPENDPFENKHKKENST
jgi:hypothetical protein